MSAELEMESQGRKSTQRPVRRRRRKQQQPGHGKDQISEGRKIVKICTGMKGGVGNHMVYQELVLTKQDIQTSGFPKSLNGPGRAIPARWNWLSVCSGKEQHLHCILLQ